MSITGTVNRLVVAQGWEEGAGVWGVTVTKCTRLLLKVIKMF